MMDFKNFTRDELLALMAANSPNPTKDYVDLQRGRDRNRNPYNEGFPKPPIREDAEIIADYKIECAKTLMVRLEKEICTKGL